MGDSGGQRPIIPNSLLMHRDRQQQNPEQTAAVWWCSGQLLFPARKSHGKLSFPRRTCKAAVRMSPKAKILAGMVKSRPEEGSAVQEPDSSSIPTGMRQANVSSQPACSYQLLKSTLRETSASCALQVLQISDLPKTRHSIYS